MFGEVIRVNCENYTKYISTLCAQNVVFLNGDGMLYVHIVTPQFLRIKLLTFVRAF
jgi:hypothetical protein